MTYDQAALARVETIRENGRRGGYSVSLFLEHTWKDTLTLERELSSAQSQVQIFAKLGREKSWMYERHAHVAQIATVNAIKDILAERAAESLNREAA